LSQLGYFDPEAFDVAPIQNDQDGTVDIVYTVAERPSDQIELSGGWGAGRVVATAGVSFTNFSVRNFFKKGAWTPLPSGDGQQLSLRVQTNGAWFRSYNLSFTEPWLGGKKPNSFSVNLQRSVQTNGVTNRQAAAGADRQALFITGGSVMFGKRLQWPDDYFNFMAGVSYLYYDIQNFSQGAGNTGVFAFTDGTANNLSFIFNISRNSIFDPIYPRYGSNVRLNAKFTLPYSLWDGVDYAGDISDQLRNKWAEYYKWKLVAEWFTELAPKFVLLARSGIGFLGYYNRDKGVSPFERFYMGGAALAGFALDGREIIAHRGYDDLSLSPREGANIIIKHTLELRYPISLNPSATIYALGFAEAGNSEFGIENWDPMRLYRSAGMGLRIFLPMFGLMGLDYGWRFDDVPGLQGQGMPKSQFHFTIGMNLGEL
jgi:outer membrane protein insertion porin family